MRSSRPIHDSHCLPLPRRPPSQPRTAAHQSQRATVAGLHDPVRTNATRSPASAAGAVAASQSATTSARNPSPRMLSSPQQHVSTVEAVVADRRRADEGPQTGGAPGQFGQAPGRFDATVADGRLVGIAERPAMDSPARCTTASTRRAAPAREAADPTAAHPRWRGVRRTNRTTR